MATSDDPKRPEDLTRRDVMKLGAATGAAVTAVAAAAKVAAGPAILKVRADNNQVKYGMIGTGSRGTYLLGHLTKVDNGHCVALCDVNQEALDKAAVAIGTNPKKYKDYRELLSDKDVDAVIIAVPLYLHFPITKDTLQAGKHTFCEKSLVFRPEEIHALRALAAEHSKQTLQVGLQRRYSKYYQALKAMVDNGDLGEVTHIHAQWHRNPGWTMKDGGKSNPKNWRLFREYSGGLTAELASHQVDIADWIFGSRPDFVMGLGGLDTWHDGRDIYDNIQLIYSYPKGRKLIYSAITTNQHLPLLNSQRPEFGEVIMGTAGAVEITVGDGQKTMPTAAWFREPTPSTVSAGSKKTETKAGASFALAGPQKALPIKTPDTDAVSLLKEPFLVREPKLARLWLYNKGILTPEEDRNPVETELESFFNDSRSGAHPKADVEVGLADSTAVILSNLAMDENRRVYFNEIDKMGVDTKPATDVKTS
jgi:predicted dehydrogenase